MRILLTGATGFIGSRVLRRVAARHEIWALYHTHPGPDLPRVWWIRHDLSLDGLPKGLPDRVDVVIQLAQSRHYREFPQRAADLFAVDTRSTFLLLEWARHAGAQRFILASTGGLYGSSDEPIVETDVLIEESGPLGFYFAVKRASELFVARYAGCFGTTILRFFFVYGSGQPGTMLMPRLANAVRDGRPIILQGEEGIRINPIHVSDAVLAIERCLTIQGSQVMNIAGPSPITLRRIAELIGQQLGHLPVFTLDSTTAPRHLVADIGNMSVLLGAPTISPGQGIVELCDGLNAEAEAAARSRS